MQGNKRSFLVTTAIAVALIVAVALSFLFEPGSAAEPLIVYCAHDSVFSESILQRFSKQTGIRVETRFDTEATKSLGLVNLLLREKENPRCDVFWNNQVLGTLDLDDEDILLPYKGVGYERIPSQFKAPDGAWTGFAARLRVYIANTKGDHATSKSIAAALDSNDLSRMAVAKPLYGTTRSHYTVLWHHWGAERLKQWHRDIRKRGIREFGGNAEVMNQVALGTCDFGWTDTDDFFAAQDAGKPVRMLPISVDLPPVAADDDRVICIPNTVAIIRGTQKLAAAQQLVDFLLSAEIELELALSASRQIPLGPVNQEELPAEVRELAEFAKRGYDLNTLGNARRECLDWMKSEYLQ